jgi:recombination protein RecA
LNAQDAQADIDSLIRKINKTYGDNSLYWVGKVKPAPVECVSTGSLLLDLAIGGGERFMGIPLGRVTEIWGPKDSGKTTLCNMILAQAQKEGRTTVFMDYEHSYEFDYAKALGVDHDKLLFGQFTEQEQGWQIAESIARTAPGAVIIIDSLAMMSPRKEGEGEMGDAQVGGPARLNAQFTRRNLGVLRKNNVALVVTNQVRHKIGTNKYERSETQGGGEAIRHALSLQIDLFPSTVTKEDKELVGRKIVATVTYSKIHKPKRRAEYWIVFGEGIDSDGELADLAPDYGAVEKRGSYYYVDGQEKYVANSRDNFRDWLRDNPELADDIRRKVIGTINTKEEENA